MEVRRQVVLYILKLCAGVFPKPNWQDLPFDQQLCVYANKWEHFENSVLIACIPALKWGYKQN